ncbi:MAG TPA: amino acid permease, partial [Gammaproteobacteria bacterium]|nr:amino acid permease [Gammaproteobacteria bacterium]
MSNNSATLRRSLTLPLVTFYGLGNILGAGIYVLIGKIAGYAGLYAPVSFLVASLLAGLTAFTYAELSSRYPLSAGEAVYVQKGFGVPQLSLLVGLLIIMTGIVSASTIARGFVGYLDVFITLPDWLVIVVLIASLGGLAIWGINQSVGTAAIFTLVEVFGLLLVIYVAAPAFSTLPERAHEFVPAFHVDAWSGIFAGAFLAFYAYVGFEDMVNVAEEVREPERNLPYAILLSLFIAACLYIVIAVVSLLVLDAGQLAGSDAPLASVYEVVTGNRPVAISIISLFAVVNGALIQIIMASRVCYGLSRQGWLPTFLGQVSPKTRTPVYASLLVILLIIVMALWLPIETLARATSYFLLLIFALINAGLIMIKRR